jgi:hypothetical protein
MNLRYITQQIKSVESPKRSNNYGNLILRLSVEKLKKELKAEVDDFSPPEMNTSNTSISKKCSILLMVIPKILIPFQTLSKQCRFLRHLQQY